MSKSSRRAAEAAQSVVVPAQEFVHAAADRLTPLAGEALHRVSPYAHQAVDAAHDTLDRLAPALDDALERVVPAVEAARDKVTERVSEDLLPKLSSALGAAASTSLATEAASRGKATLAAARGELSLPDPEPERKGSWLKRLAVVAAVAGVAVVVARKFLGSNDADWQSARPTTPYAPPKPATSSAAPVTVPVSDPVTEAPVGGEAGDDPQEGASAHDVSLEANGEAEPEQPAEGGEAEAEPTADVPTDAVLVEEIPAEATTTEDGPLEEAVAVEETVVESSTYGGEGAYVGTEPPEGFVIKGNERSMKYHVPESSGYNRTIAEVWFNSEEAAQAAGFIRAQR